MAGETVEERIAKLEGRVERAARYCRQMEARIEVLEAADQAREVANLRRAISGMGAVASAFTKRAVQAQ